MWRNRFTTAFLIAVWLLTPDVLCLLPGINLTMEEHECCERMAGQCGRIPMPEFHKCCQSVKRAEAIVTSKPTDYPELQTATLPFIIRNLDSLLKVVHSGRGQPFKDSPSPPLIPQHSIDILRI